MAGSTVMRARAVLSDPRRVRPAISLGHSCRIVLMMFCNLTIYPSIDFFPSCFFGQGEESALHPSIKYGFLHHRFLYVEVFFTAYSCQCYLWESISKMLKVYLLKNEINSTVWQEGACHLNFANIVQDLPDSSSPWLSLPFNNK